VLYLCRYKDLLIHEDGEVNTDETHKTYQSNELNMLTCKHRKQVLNLIRKWPHTNFFLGKLW